MSKPYSTTGGAKMYQIGDLIVYGGTGVCRVEAVDTPKPRPGEAARQYYLLKPLYQDGTIRIPVDTKVFMRPVISREEAEKLIDAIPGMSAEVHHDRNFTQLAAHYQEALGSHSCSDLIELVMSIYAKKQYVESRKRKFGQVDARFMKRAENLLYGEFSVALGIPFDDVQGYIAGRVSGAAEE